MSDRAEILEVMAQGAYAYATGGMGWETATDITKGKMRELAESALTALEASGRAVVPGWQPIESAPKDGNTILVAVYTDFCGWVRGYARWDGARGIYGWISQGFTDPPGNLGLGNPSHWMPLPRPPSKE